MKDVHSRKTGYQRSGFDRRTGMDRRVVIDLDYLAILGHDRRRQERRSEGEKRKGWIRYTQWSSVYVGEKVPEETTEVRPSAEVEW